MSKVLIFCTEATVVPHYAAITLVGGALRDQGHDVVATFCRGVIPRCVVLDSLSLPGNVDSSATGQLCGKCQNNARTMLGSFGMKAFDLAAHMPSREICDDFIATFRDNLVEATVDGVALGRLALHDVILAYKIADVEEMSVEMWQLHESLTRSALMIFLAIKSVVTKYGFERVLVYNQYVQNMAAIMAAQAVGAEGRIVFQISHRNVDRQWICLEPREWRETWYDHLQAWPKWRNVAWKPEFIRAAADDILARFGARGSHMYSPAKTLDSDVRKTLGIADHARIVVAFTSSLDERVAQDQISHALRREERGFGVDVFESQIEWLAYLVQDFVQDTSKHLVVRVHPREGANKREKRLSGHLVQLKERFSILPPNVTFLWPEDPISSYDLMELADACVIAWSTIGLEAARLGIPVFSPFGNCHVYPNDTFLRFPANREQHIADLNRAIGRVGQVDIKSILLAFRWYLVTRFSNAVHIGDVIPSHDFGGLMPYRKPRNAAQLEQQALYGPRIETERLTQPSGTAEQRGAEVNALRGELRRIIHFLFTGERLEGDIFLEVSLAGEEPGQALEPGTTYFSVRKGHCRYFHDGKVMQRYSSAAARLASVAAHLVHHVEHEAAPHPPDIG